MIIVHARLAAAMKGALRSPAGTMTQPAGNFQSTTNHPGGKMALHKWMYRAGRPNKLARILNRGWAILHSLGISPNYLITLEVVGRKSGAMTSFPLVMTVVNGERYLVSMLGEQTNWVRNIKAAGGKARVRHGIIEQVLLEEVDAGQRASILKAYLQHAPGARPHVSISKDAPLSEFEKITSKYPVFRLQTME
jgi:deazaflavin-dependent oxidoreductase (nitroreductase family)